MELDQLKKIWKEYDQVIEPKLELHTELLKEASVKKVQSFLFEFRLENYLELLINGIASYFLFRLLLVSIGNLKFFLTIAFVLGTMVLELAWNIYKLVQADRLSYKRPLIENLKVLERLRLYTRWEIRSLLVFIPAFTAAFLILIPKIFLDLDVIPILGMGLWYVVLGSVAVGVIIVAALSFFPDKKMDKAISFLREISQYESEE